MSDPELKGSQHSEGDLIEDVLEDSSEVDLGDTNENLDFNQQISSKHSVAVEYVLSYKLQDEAIGDILKRWGLSELCELFYEKKIDSDCLEHITVSDIDNLIPLEMMGLRIKFKARLTEWRSLKSLPLTSISENLSGCSSSAVSVSSDIMEAFPKNLRSDSENSFNQEVQHMNVQQILKSNSRGKLLLSKKTAFNSSDRKDLIYLIVDFALFNEILLGTKEINSLTEQIIKLFPFESKTSYFVPSGSGGRARGQLYSAYNNKIKALRKRGVLSRRSKHHVFLMSDNSSSSSPSSPSCSPLADNSQNLNEKDWLKYNSQPIELVVIKWKSCFHIRRAEILEKTAEDIFNDWPLFTQSIGLHLIDLDFILLFGEEKSVCLKKKWDSFQRTFLQSVEDQLESASKPVKQILEQINAIDSSQDYKNLLTYKLIHYKLPPFQKISLQSGKKWHASIQDSINSTILEAENQADILVKYQHIKESYKGFHFNIQPMVVASEKLYYVISDNIFHKTESFLSALDSAFKLIYVFNLKYPLQSQNVWLFLENFFYDLNSTPPSSATTALINELRDKQN